MSTITITPIPKVTHHKRGNIYLHQGQLYQLVHLDNQGDNDHTMCIIYLSGGNRMTFPIHVPSFTNVTDSDFRKMGGGDDFQLVKNLNIAVELA